MDKMMTNLLGASWRTTLTAILTIALSLLPYADPILPEGWSAAEISQIILTIGMALGLTLARDNKTSVEAHEEDERWTTTK